LTRQVNDNEIFFSGAASKITITKLELCIPQITPSVEIETKLLNSMTKDIKFSFLKRNTYSTTFNNQTMDWNIQNTSNTPRYILVAFKNAPSAIATNNSKFWIKGVEANNIIPKITKMQVRLNSERYPIDPVNIDPEKDEVNQSYHNYFEMCKTFNVNPQFDYTNFLKNYPIFCFNVSAHDENLTKNGVQIVINIEKNTAVELTGYCLVLEEQEHVIKIMERHMTRIE